MINVHDHDHLHHHKYHHYQPSLLEAAHLKADLARPTLLQQPPIKYEDDRDCGDIDDRNHYDGDDYCDDQLKDSFFPVLPL